MAIPLHASLPWVDRVEQNVRRLRPVARVLVSDVSGRDGALAELRARLGDHPAVEWSARTDVEPGWVAHCNALREQATTEYFMWLAHDDTVEPSWVTEGEKALAANPAAVIAVGHLESVKEDREPRTVAPVAEYAAADPIERIAASLDRLFVGQQDGLGHSFRGLMRREAAPPLPFIDGQGTKADMYWALTLLGRGLFVPIEATYTKYWHSLSASADWIPVTRSPDFRKRLAAALRELPVETREGLFLTAWTDEAMGLRERIGRLEERVQRQKARLSRS